MDKQAKYNELQETQRKLWAEHMAANEKALQGRNDYSTATDAAAVEARSTYKKWAASFNAQIDAGCQ